MRHVCECVCSSASTEHEFDRTRVFPIKFLYVCASEGRVKVTEFVNTLALIITRMLCGLWVSVLACYA